MLRSNVLVSVLTWFVLAAPAVAWEPVRYARDVRPILAAACFRCHGADEEARQGELRLDDPASAHALRDGSAAIVPGAAAESLLFQRITAGDESIRMPPADEPRQLTADELALLRRWIAEGGSYQVHWAFESPTRPPLPPTQQRQWVRNPVDRFVLSRLESSQLQSSPAADRSTLIRRLTLDLTGLPPTPQEVERFVSDSRPDAYQQLVSRLLASPAYGERIALEWLDAARYADTHGYHEDYHREMWPWRDWVIEAFNNNMPFDQFTVEQIAGDLLPAATAAQVVATGFNRNHGVTASGISEEYRVEYVLDRVRTTSTVWLGLTMQCAQCHAHKYDPLTQRDFYRFFAYFNNITDRGVENREGNVDPLVQVASPLIDRQRILLEKQIHQAEKQQAEVGASAAPRLAKWEKEQLADAADQPILPEGLQFHLPFDASAGNDVIDRVSQEPVGVLAGSVRREMGQVGGAVALDGKSYLDLGDRFGFERTDAFSYGAWIYRGGDSGAIIARMDDANQYRGWDLFLAGGHAEFHLIHQWPANAIHAKSTQPVPAETWTHLFVTYDGTSKASGFQLYYDGVAQQVNVTQDSLSETIRTDKPLHVGRRNPSGYFAGRIDDVRIYQGALSPAGVATLAGFNPVRMILQRAAEDRSEEQQQQLRQYYLENVDPAYREQATRLTALKARHAELSEQAAAQTVMVMQEMPERRATFLLKRGQYDQHGGEVTAGTPAFLHPLAEDARPDRLGLARWIVDPANPLTSRVTVNRLWQMLFGTGLVASSEDFGTQGELPSHPELLDWLACEFVASGWDVKRLVRLLVTSATYRQDAAISSQAWQQDPANRLLGRGSRFRMSAEAIRDNALAVSGLLVARSGGPSVKPYQPDGLWLETSNRPYVQDSGSKLYRRSLYVYWKRSVPPPNLFAIDAPTRETCTVRRQRTNTPLMALVMLNDPVFVEAARQLAERALLEGGGDADAAIAGMFFRATARRPDEQEKAILEEIYQQQLAIYTANPEAAGALLAVGESPRDRSLDTARHAALAMVANTILNLDETITRE